MVKNYEIELLQSKAKIAHRRRLNLNVHETFDDPIQKFFNAICSDSYIRPHRHSNESGEELIFAVEGEFVLFIFAENGDISEYHFCSPDKLQSQHNRLVVVPPQVWHTVLSMSDDCALLEIKKGPYNEKNAKEFAPWSPPANTSEASSYIEYLRRIATT